MLVAADVDDLAVVELLLSDLPGDTYGQVLVEVPEDVEVPALATPPRMTVHRLARAADAEPGVVLAGAVASWAAEWAPDEPDLARAVQLWAGATVRERLAPVGAPLLPL